MHNLASNNKHGVEGSETSLLQCFAAAGQFSQSQLSAVNLRLHGLLLWNNHILTTRCESVTAGLTKHCF